MKPFRSITIALALAILAVGTAVADDSNFGIGIKAGTLGLGLEGRWAPLPFMDLRLGGNAYNLDVNDNYSDVRYKGTLDLQTFYLTANFRFPLSPFRITAGAFANNNEIRLASAEVGDFSIGGDFYTGSEVGTLMSRTTFDSTAPYLGIGFDFELFGKAGLDLDLGLLWQGEPQVTLVADGLLAGDPSFQASLAREQTDLQDDISDFKAYPVVSLAFVYNF